MLIVMTYTDGSRDCNNVINNNKKLLSKKVSIFFSK